MNDIKDTISDIPQNDDNLAEDFIRECILIPPKGDPSIVRVNFTRCEHCDLLNCHMVDYINLPRAEKYGYLVALFVDDMAKFKKLPINSVASRLACMRVNGPALIVDDQTSLSLPDLNILLKVVQ